jgi:hypothetical protein
VICCGLALVVCAAGALAQGPAEQQEDTVPKGTASASGTEPKERWMPKGAVLVRPGMKNEVNLPRDVVLDHDPNVYGQPVSRISVTSSPAQDAVDLLWKARALQAVDKIKALVTDMNDPSRQVTIKTRYEAMLEFAYAQVIANSDLVVKRSPKGTSYHLVLNYGDDGLLDVLYSYDNETGECFSFSIDRLPKHRRIGLSASTPDIVLLMNPDDPYEPGLAFHKSSPFLTCVVDSPEQPRMSALDALIIEAKYWNFAKQYDPTGTPPIVSVQVFRKAHPECAGLSDVKLARRVYAKFYADMPLPVFKERFGVDLESIPPQDLAAGSSQVKRGYTAEELDTIEAEPAGQQHSP